MGRHALFCPRHCRHAFLSRPFSAAGNVQFLPSAQEFFRENRTVRHLSARHRGALGAGRLRGRRTGHSATLACGGRRRLRRACQKRCAFNAHACFRRTRHCGLCIGGRNRHCAGPLVFTGAARRTGLARRARVPAGDAASGDDSASDPVVWHRRSPQDRHRISLGLFPDLPQYAHGLSQR